MRRILSLATFFLLFLVPLAENTQVRVERDAQGNILITNRGSRGAGKTARKRAGRAVPSVSPARVAEIKVKLKKACRERSLDCDLVSQLVRVESGFRPNVLSKRGAVGLMQLMPKTARLFGCDNPWNLDQNISAGTAFLAYLMKRYNNSVPLVLAAYNAGEDAVGKYGGKIPPYGETVRYVFSILDGMGRRDLVEQAKKLLASPDDYRRFYLNGRGRKSVLRIYYMYVDKENCRHIYDYPPGDVDAVPIVYKDE